MIKLKKKQNTNQNKKKVHKYFSCPSKSIPNGIKLKALKNFQSLKFDH
jgi:hypothetical protein